MRTPRATPSPPLARLREQPAKSRLVQWASRNLRREMRTKAEALRRPRERIPGDDAD
jgi:hypothetical protein